MKIPVKEIQIKEGRFREDFGEIVDLMESLDKHGLIQPIVVTEDNVLIAGERRLRAAKELGWTEIEVKRLDDLSELERRELELEENYQRKDFTWEEEVRAKAEIHSIKQRIHGAAVKGHESDGWGQADTARALDEALGNLNMDLKLAEALDQYPQLHKAPNKSQARKLLRQIQEREILEALAEKTSDEGALDLITFRQGDCRDLLAQMPDHSIDLVIADPPWGIGFDTKSRQARSNITDYQDESEDSMMLIYEALLELHRVMAPDSHLYLFFGVTTYPEVLVLLEEAQFSVSSIPLIWNKSSGGSPGLGKTHPNAYETIFFARKGSRKLSSGTSNVFSHPRPNYEDRWHSAQKPVELLVELIECSSSPGETVLDPFAGSGATGLAAVQLEREAILIEKDPKNYAAMTEHITQRLKADAIERSLSND